MKLTDLLEKMYAHFYKMDINKRDKQLLEIFGWKGREAFLVIKEARLKDSIND